MKIALVATEKLPVPAIRGGAIQIYLEAIAPILAKKHQVTVFSIEDDALPAVETRDRVRYVRFNQEAYLPSIMNFLSTETFDVIHVCNRPHWMTKLREKAHRTKFILSVHNEMFADGKIDLSQGEEVIANVSKIVTVSDFIGRTISDRFPTARNKLETVYSGVDISHYSPVWTKEGQEKNLAMREKLAVRDKKIILFVGRLSKVKGPHILLQALPELIESHPEVSLVFIGSKWFGDDEVNNYVKYLYRLGNLYPDHVNFIKFVEPADIPSYYSMADVFVCCSQWQEPLARVHYEAMAAGLPVITTNRGGNAEVIQHNENGFVIERFDQPSEYAKYISQLLDSQELRNRMGKAGRAIVEKNFSFHRVAAQLQHIYETAH